jgi:pimeloyl-ACP methyl ester carboxylesterase
MVSKRFMPRMLTAAIVCVIGFLAFSWYCAYKFTSPNRTKIVYPESLSFPHEDVLFSTSDGIGIKGWYFTKDSSGKAVVLLHGWKANRMETLPRVRFLYEAGYNVLVYDARGCGESGGEKISIGYYETEDLAAAVKFLKGRGNSKIGCIGISQGGATILLAAGKVKNDVSCVVSESTYSTIPDAVNNRFAAYLKIPGKAFGYFIIRFAELILNLNAEEMKPAEKVRELNCPVLIAGGQNDNRTLQENTMAIYNNANEPKELWLIEGAGHEDLFMHQGSEYERRVLEFLGKSMR